MLSSSELTAPAWEAALCTALGRGWSLQTMADSGVDIVRADGTWAIEIKSSVLGARDLHAALMALAFYVDRHPAVEHATVVARFPRMSGERALEEWRRVHAVMRPGIARRLSLVALAADQDFAVPSNNPAVTRLVALARQTFSATSPEEAPRTAATRWSHKSFEVWKVLLDAWLRREPPLPLHELQKRSGASHPSVSAVLTRLEENGELQRTSSRSAMLRDLPRSSLAEVLALGDSLRETRRYVDRSGRAPNARDLVRRFIAKESREAALGGVEAARHYMSSFDLNGLPRVDVTVTAQDDLAWVKKVDPALAEAPSGSSPVLVVHRMRRPERFDRTASGSFADPAEVLLDLHELRLVDQANEFVSALRKGSTT